MREIVDILEKNKQINIEHEEAKQSEESKGDNPDEQQATRPPI